MIVDAEVYELTGPGDLVTRTERLDLSQLDPNAVAARTLVSAISPGTELAAFLGYPPLRPMQTYPRVIGYCNVAEVVAVGDAVTDLEPGSRVLSFQSHRSAFICARADVTPLPATADIIACSAAYFFHLGYAAVLRARPAPDQHVAVIGLGTIGLATVAVAAMAGARVTAVSGRESAPAPEMGACQQLTPSQAEGTLGGDIDTVITTSNRWADWRLALTCARHGGTVASLGFPGRGEPPPDFNPLDSRWLYDKQLAIVGCGLIPDATDPAAGNWYDIKTTLPLIISRVLDHTLPARRLVSEVVSSRALAKTYERLAAREPGLITCVLEW